tara:strand:- start:1367 stop:2140 length:774 start_codon:yes stop_codon:yes gene_type:complete
MSDKMVKKSNSELSIGNINADLIVKNAGKGLQNVSNDDITIPRLAIIQSGSPQRKKKDEKYIEGAEEGMIFNTVTNEVYEKIEVIPCGYRKTYVEWVPRDKGGGLVEVHDSKPEGTTTDPKTRKSMLGENQIVDTAEHFVLVKTSKDSYSPAVLTMTSSNLSVSRKWNTLLKMKRINVKGQTVEAPSFLFEFALSTVEAENDLGNWHKYKLEEIGMIESKDVFKEAETLADSVTQGKVKASEPINADTSTDDTKTPF